MAKRTYDLVAIYTRSLMDVEARLERLRERQKPILAEMGELEREKGRLQVLLKGVVAGVRTEGGEGGPK